MLKEKRKSRKTKETNKAKKIKKAKETNEANEIKKANGIKAAKEIMEVKKIKENAITLIALIVTIIVLLILAGVTISTLSAPNGILNQANSAKMETAVAAVKENLRLEQTEKVIEQEEMTPETLLTEGKVNRTVQQAEDGNYYMYYVLKEDAVDGMQGLGKGNIASLKDVFLIDDNLNVKYIASNGSEYGDELEDKILEDETKIRFASKAFSEYVSTISGATEEEMKFEWMKNQTSLTITDPAVDSLEDLVFFPNLESLTLGENASNAPNITKMDGVENCTKLKTLIINYGPDKDYTVIKNLSQLREFRRNFGTDWDNIIDALKFCDNLEILNCRNLNVNMKRLAELKNIKDLTLTNSEITKIDGLDNFVDMTNLNLANNKIENIEGLENLKNLEVLYLSNNDIVDITPLSSNSSLTSLDLLHNPKIDGNRENYTGKRLEALNEIGKILDRGGDIFLDVDKLGLFTNYKKIKLNNQNLTTLEPLEGLTQLAELVLSDNQLTLEDTKSQQILESMTNLTRLELNYNQLKNIKPINNLKKLKLLYLIGENNNVDLSEIEDIISNLNALHVSTESLKTIVNCDVNKITKLGLSSSSLTELPDLSKFNKLLILDLTNNPNISNFENVSQITSLQNLYLSNNNLHGRMIDFSKLTNLTNLNLSNNTLWSEDLENLKVLKNNTNLTIDLSNNSIIDATALLELNPDTKIILTGNINLSQDSKIKLEEHFGDNVTF